MRWHRRIALALLEWVERVLGQAREGLRAERDRCELDAIRLECGGWADGAWVRVVSIRCEKCACENPVGSVRRIKRFTTEARNEGEWVFDKPETSFCHVAGTVLEAASPMAVALQGIR